MRRCLVAVACGAVAVVAALTVQAMTLGGPTSVDVSLSTWVAAHRTDQLIAAMEVVTLAGSFAAVLVVGAVCVLWAAVRKDWRPFLVIVPVAAVASSATNLLKLLVGRPRPGEGIALRDFSGYSFPSGHATTAAALWGAVAAFLVLAGRWRLRTGLVCFATMAALVSASRIVLGAHWLTDVVAGAATGTALVAAAILLRGEARSRGPSRGGPG
jgi:undecaprenyl-diphosphatase